jgi:hypothetical protein
VKTQGEECTGKPAENLNRGDASGTAGGGDFETWSRAMSDLINAGPSLETSARALDSYLTMTASAHKIFTQFMAQILGQLNMPTQSDVIGLAERLTNIETRLDDLDARLDDIARAIEIVTNALPPGSVISSGKAPEASPSSKEIEQDHGNRQYRSGRRKQQQHSL